MPPTIAHVFRPADDPARHLLSPDCHCGPQRIAVRDQYGFDHVGLHHQDRVGIRLGGSWVVVYEPAAA